MAIANLTQLKEQIGFTDDVGADDDDMLSRQLDAAQTHIDRRLGFGIEASFGGQDQDPIPADLVEAVLMLAAWWYLQREAATDDGRPKEVPFGVKDIIHNYRDWTF